MSSCFGRAAASETERCVELSTASTSGRDLSYPGNYTSTTKYTLLTFLPKALYEQYRRVANIFFTLQAALSLTPFSPIRPWTTWTPLCIVLSVSLIKEAREDYKRYKQDKEINHRLVLVFNPITRDFEERRWQDLQVGDIVKVRKDEQLPADLLFLASEHEEGTCYVETMNLDGETNLKIKAAPDATKDLTHDSVADFSGRVKCEGPNARLYQFTGNLELAHSKETVPLSASSILLRGCSLRNTSHILGVVIYSGHDTKIMCNSTEAPSKRSRVERNVDKVMMVMFALLFLWCLITAVYFSSWTVSAYRDHWYMRPDVADIAYDSGSRLQTGIVSFFVSLVLYSYLIPISLYVSIELVKVVQSMVFMSCDRDMYDPVTDTPALARTSNLNEELGQVTSIMTDKTGTLTQNVMEFFKCSIAGVAYGAGVTEIERANASRRGTLASDMDDPAATKYKERFFNFYDSRLMGDAWTREKDPATIEMFYRLLAVCHTIIPDGPAVEAEIKYEAESPDEAALVVAAKVFGFFFFKRTNTTVTVRECGPHTGGKPQDREYEVLNILEFNSTRKRMSVVVRAPDGKLIIFCKGADTVIYERLDPKWPANADMKVKTSEHMEEFGSAGLRTLCLSYTEVDPAFYNAWQEKWVEAKTSLVDRDDKVAAVSEEIEKNLRLLGCTAIEDKLQDGVPECIKQLAMAGIRIWVLTGDKMETAINIGFACSLLEENMLQLTLHANSPQADALEEAGDRERADRMRYEMVQKQLQLAETQLTPGMSNHAAIIIDGKALSYALSEGLRRSFLQVGLLCKAVICCRVSPLQKAHVTELVRSHGSTTLAIGDGANDVGMIQKAHIGVGISGQEGMQAVMSADFAIAQFRFLVPLLLVHGHYSYRRLSRMIKFFMYKNLLLGVTLFVYNGFAKLSGSYIYNDTTMTLYNVIFTAVSPIIIGLFDRDVDKRMLMRFPQLYRRGAMNYDFNAWAIAQWLMAALLQAGIIMVVVIICTPARIAGVSGGQTFDMASSGLIMFGSILITVHLQLVIVEEAFTWLHHLAIWGSLGAWWMYLVGFGAFPVDWSLEMWRLFLGITVGIPSYWLLTLLVPIAACLPSFATIVIRQHFQPDDIITIRELHAQTKRARRSSSVMASSAGRLAMGRGPHNRVHPGPKDSSGAHLSAVPPLQDDHEDMPSPRRLSVMSVIEQVHRSIIIRANDHHDHPGAMEAGYAGESMTRDVMRFNLGAFGAEDDAVVGRHGSICVRQGSRELRGAQSLSRGPAPVVTGPGNISQGGQGSRTPSRTGPPPVCISGGGNGGPGFSRVSTNGGGNGGPGFSRGSTSGVTGGGGEEQVHSGRAASTGGSTPKATRQLGGPSMSSNGSSMHGRMSASGMVAGAGASGAGGGYAPGGGARSARTAMGVPTAESVTHLTPRSANSITLQQQTTGGAHSLNVPGELDADGPLASSYRDYGSVHTPVERVTLDQRPSGIVQQEENEAAERARAAALGRLESLS